MNSSPADFSSTVQESDTLNETSVLKKCLFLFCHRLFFFLCIYFSRKENILSSRCPDICKIFCYFFWMVTGKGLKLYVYQKLYELDELLVKQKYYFYKTRKNVFPNWCKIQSSYKERENTEFHTTVERVIQNNFKVYCHRLCQSLKMFSAPSSTCLFFFFFHSKPRFARKGILYQDLIGNSDGGVFQLKC